MLPGTVLFRPGEVPAALYLVLDGVVEISREESAELGMRPVAYMGAGSTVSESKVITGSVLTSLAQFPEGGVTLTWPRPVLLRQLYSSQDLALHYLQSLARRLEGTIVNLGANEGSNLGGRLEHFDLPAILQTVVDSGGGGRARDPRRGRAQLRRDPHPEAQHRSHALRPAEGPRGVPPDHGSTPETRDLPLFEPRRVQGRHWFPASCSLC